MAAVEVASLAASQWGLITAAQASQAGIARMQLTRMVKVGLLDRVIHGVYATPGVQADQYLDLRAAWLALAPEATAEARLTDLTAAGVVSHASAAQLLGVGDLIADEHEFTVPHRHQTRRAGLRVRRGTLKPEEITISNGLPVTTAARTVADLLLIGHELEHVAAIIADSLRQNLTDGPSLETALAPAARRHHVRDGSALLLLLLDLAGMSPADLERQLLDSELGRELVVRASGRPELQALDLLSSSPETLAALTQLAQVIKDSTITNDELAHTLEMVRQISFPVARIDLSGVRTALAAVAQTQRIYDSAGMREALASAAQAMQTVAKKEAP
ncbi:hypothetical protein Kisp02_49030 [Kineosporia sp. NBRC 101731]|nr:hypothetical protein Kisp02_49030 [Kineosporia sp. NBRC 101731]